MERKRVVLQIFVRETGNVTSVIEHEHATVAPVHLPGDFGRVLFSPFADIPIFIQLVLRFVDDPFDEVSNNLSVLPQ